VFNTTYEIDGFRSLRDFHVELTPGLNVLVGPNGSGKTNFLDFLGFLDTAVFSGATNAVSNSGGVAKVFSQENTTRNLARLEARISGIADLREVPMRTDSDLSRPLFYYSYDFELRFSRAQSAVFFSKESLRIYKLFSEDDDRVASQIVGSIQAVRRAGGEDPPADWQFGSRLLVEHDRNPLSKVDAAYSKQKIVDRIPRLRTGNDHSILTRASRYDFPALEAVRVAIVRGRSFNIAPNKAREAEDISRVPGIGRDGSGLAATLFALQGLRKASQPRRLARLPKAEPRSLDEMLEWSRLVLPELEDIQVQQDPHTGKFSALLLMASAQTLKIPLASASDGTLKWLSLVALILTSGGVYSLEEPENFLHPRMQQNLVQLIRESFADASRGSYFVFSTHSETLINCCRPEELVIFEFMEGATVCSRIDDPSAVLNEINRTGFGLGYYFANNALPQGARVRRGHNGEDVPK